MPQAPDARRRNRLSWMLAAILVLGSAFALFSIIPERVALPDPSEVEKVTIAEFAVPKQIDQCNQPIYIYGGGSLPTFDVPQRFITPLLAKLGQARAMRDWKEVLIGRIQLALRDGHEESLHVYYGDPLSFRTDDGRVWGGFWGGISASAVLELVHEAYENSAPPAGDSARSGAIRAR